jgi:hypothetical protein
VGTGRNSDMPSSKLCLWDDSQKEIASEVEFARPILDLKVVGEWITIVDEKMVYVFNLEQESGLEYSLA